MKILITGADSFVGSYLVPQLIAGSHELFLIGGNNARLTKNYPEQIIVSYINLTQEKLESDILSFQPEIVIHLAAYSTPNDNFSDYEKLIDANILFLGKLLTSLFKVPPKLFVNTGSSFEYFKGNKVLDPAYLYTATKTASRFILKYYTEAYEFKYCTVCPYSIYGGVDSRKKVLDYIRESLNASTPQDLSPGKQVMDFIHVEDLVNLYCAIISHPDVVENEMTFHAGSGKGYTLRELSALIENISGLKANINWGALPYRKRDVMHAVADIRLQQKLFNWKPLYNLEEGLKAYLKLNKVI